MKKKLFALLMVSVIATMLFAGCSSESSSSTIESVDDKNVHAEFENAEDAGGIAYITLGEGEVLVYDHALNDDADVELKFYQATGAEADADAEIEDIIPEGTEPVLALNLDSGGGGEAQIPAGEYVISIQVLKKATGTIDLSTRVLE